MTALGLRRGACPSLSAPMQTGDGLLVRLNPRNGALSPAQLCGVAAAAEKFGNGLLEITARGSLQVRGLSAASAPRFAEAVQALKIEAAEGVEVRTGALAGLDAGEIADPRPLAEKLRAVLGSLSPTAKLAPKLSITVDGGGALPLDGLLADLRLKAVRPGGAGMWGLQAGTIRLGIGTDAQALTGAVAVLEMLADRGMRARGKDFCAADLATVASPLTPWHCELPDSAAALPVGAFALKDGATAHGFAPAFGQILAPVLAAFCGALPEAAELRLAPGRGVLVIGGDGERLAVLAAEAGLVGRSDDLRLKVATCAGAPGCASAWANTKQLAARIVDEAPALLRGMPALHVSGCSKGCAKPAGPAVSLIGRENGIALAQEGFPLDPRLAKSLEALAQAGAGRTKVPA